MTRTTSAAAEQQLDSHDCSRELPTHLRVVVTPDAKERPPSQRGDDDDAACGGRIAVSADVPRAVLRSSPCHGVEGRDGSDTALQGVVQRRTNLFTQPLDDRGAIVKDTTGS
jgi:hypothetical protein